MSKCKYDNRKNRYERYEIYSNWSSLNFCRICGIGSFWTGLSQATFEADEFGTCYEYSDEAPPKEINCSYKIFDQTIFFGIVLALIAGGVIALIKGVKGNWDNKVKPEDMVGPGGNQNDSPDKPKED